MSVFLKMQQFFERSAVYVIWLIQLLYPLFVGYWPERSAKFGRVNRGDRSNIFWASTDSKSVITPGTSEKKCCQAKKLIILGS